MHLPAPQAQGHGHEQRCPEHRVAHFDGVYLVGTAVERGEQVDGRERQRENEEQGEGEDGRGPQMQGAEPAVGGGNGRYGHDDQGGEQGQHGCGVVAKGD